MHFKCRESNVLPNFPTNLFPPSLSLPLFYFLFSLAFGLLSHFLAWVLLVRWILWDERDPDLSRIFPLTTSILIGLFEDSSFPQNMFFSFFFSLSKRWDQVSWFIVISLCLFKRRNISSSFQSITSFLFYAKFRHRFDYPREDGSLVSPDENRRIWRREYLVNIFCTIR